MDDTKVVLGLSGGIDSAASAIMLKEKGYFVTALYFDVCKEKDEEALYRAKSLAKNLNIDFIHVNVTDEFERLIIKPFCESYIKGFTPMPCIICNPLIKWAVLKDYADRIDAKYISTGHYARITNIDNTFYVQQSLNLQKDQSYMLAMLNQDILSRAVFPLSSFTTKEQVKLFLQYRGYTFAENISESQDICFIKTDYKDFLKKNGYISKPGYFVNEDGEILGSHGSYSDFTIGQGRGFGMGFNKKMYVKSIEPDSGNVVLCENDHLFTNKVYIRPMNFAKYGNTNSVPNEYIGNEFEVKIRYAAKKSKAIVNKISDDLALLDFTDPQRAPAKGQFAVLYKNDLVIGCGIIV